MEERKTVHKTVHTIYFTERHNLSENFSFHFPKSYLKGDLLRAYTTNTEKY